MLTFDEIERDDEGLDLDLSTPRSRVELVDDEPDEPLDDVYLGGNPEQEELQRYREAKAKERILNDTPQADKDRLISQLLARVERNEQLMRKMTSFGGITLPEEAANSGFQEMERQLRGQLRGKTHAKVLIHTSEKLGENWNIPLRINGKPPVGFDHGVPRGKVVTLPVAFVEVLQHAVVSGYQRLVGPDGNPHNVYVHYLRYPFTILG